MNWSKSLLVLALPAAILACEAEEPVEEGTEAVVAVPEPAPGAAPAPATTPAEPGMAGQPTTVEMSALNNSGVTGQATLTPMGQQTQVMVTLNAQQAGTHQGHIHTGTCDSPGGVVQPLQPITTDATGSGSMTTTVAVDPMTVMDGQHIVVYHEAGGNPGQPVVCGAIPAHQM